MENLNKEIEILYRAHYRPLCLYALHFISDSGMGKDIVHDCFIEFIRRLVLSEVEIKNSKAYLYTMVRNKSFAVLRAKSLTVVIDDASDVIDDEEEGDADEHLFIEARLWAKIDELPKKCREIFLMNKMDGMKCSEIAERLKISAKTVENQISKARKIISLT